MNIEISRGPAADQLLSDEGFLADWASLCARCPWATAFQGHPFTRAWYSLYRHLFEPVLVYSRADDGALQGLLALAFSSARRPADRLIVAGGIQAEYHAWVTAPPLGNTFPAAAFESIRREIPSSKLTFQYLPPNTPTAWAVAPEAGRRCLLRAHRRPLVVFGDGTANAESLSKRSNKRKLKDLDKMGGLEFRRVTDPGEFSALFDDMVRLYDFRHGAVQGSPPFCSTAELQKEFHCAMLNVPGLLHVTSMRVGGRLAAAHFGVVSGKELQLGTIVHDPFLAKQSPGKFQILLLCQMLIGEGLERLDLTPGGDAYKERFASDWDEVHTLTVLPTALRRTKALVYMRAKLALKDGLKRLGVTPAQAAHSVRATLWKLKHPAALVLALVRGAGGWVASRQEVRVYCRAIPEPLRRVPSPPRAGSFGPGSQGLPPKAQLLPGGTAADAPIVARRDALDDLLAYRPAGAGASKQAFLSAALSRIEEGQHAYTRAARGRLQACGWMAERPSAELVAALLPGLTLPPDGVLLHGFQVFAPGGAEWPAATCLRAMLDDAAGTAGVRHAFVVVPADDAPARRAAEALGFTCDSRLFVETRLGRSRCRAQGPLAVAPDDSATKPVAGAPDRSDGSDASHGSDAPDNSGELVKSNPSAAKGQDRKRRPAAKAERPGPLVSGEVL